MEATTTPISTEESSEPRQLTSEEIEVLQTKKNRGTIHPRMKPVLRGDDVTRRGPSVARVAVTKQGNFTTATILLGELESGVFVPDVILTGTAKRNPEDRYNPIRGQMTAFKRAVSKRDEKGRPVS